jgi:Flp pilus assembly pilin Flp
VRRNSNAVEPVQEVAMLPLVTRLRVLAFTLAEAVKTRVRDERGQTSAEYVGLVVLITVLVVAFVAAAPGIGQTITNGITTLIQKIISKGQ